MKELLDSTYNFPIFQCASNFVIFSPGFLYAMLCWKEGVNIQFCIFVLFYFFLCAGSVFDTDVDHDYHDSSALFSWAVFHLKKDKKPTTNASPKSLAFVPQLREMKCHKHTHAWQEKTTTKKKLSFINYKVIGGKWMIISEQTSSTCYDNYTCSVY